MIPFEDYAAEGDSIYLAVHGKYADRLADIANSACDMPFDDFRLLLLVFSDRLEVQYLCDSSTIFNLPEVITKNEFHTGNWLDPVIGVVLADHMAVRKRETPLLFVFSDGDVKTDWYKGLLPLLIKFVWLNEPTTEPLLTPFGVRREIEFGAQAWEADEATVPVTIMDKETRIEPSPHVVRRDAMLASAAHTDHTSESNLEAMSARISAEVTKQANEARARATCELCRKPQRQGCKNGVLTNGSDCPDRPQKTP